MHAGEEEGVRSLGDQSDDLSGQGRFSRARRASNTYDGNAVVLLPKDLQGGVGSQAMTLSKEF